jgi:hypothetical protein
VALQTTLARFLTPGANLVDLLFVAVVYVALTGGPVAGLMAGAIGGLTQDALAATGYSVVAVGSGIASARSIVGIGGLAKCLVGFVVGMVGIQFIVGTAVLRALVFFTATVAHAIIFLGLYSVLDPGRGGIDLTSAASQGAANAVIGVLLFEIGEFMPGFLDRRRESGGRMRINRRLD